MSLNNLFSTRIFQDNFHYLHFTYVINRFSLINMLKCYINIARCELNFCEVLFLVGVQISLNSVVESASNKNQSKFSQCQQFVMVAVGI